VDALQQLQRRDRERSRQLHQRVDAGKAGAVLEHPDLGPVQGGEVAKLFLGHGSTTAAAEQVAAKLDRDLFRSNSPVAGHTGSVTAEVHCRPDNTSQT
jgi:hypothetical protein